MIARLPDLLVCPQCQSEVRETRDGMACQNRDCGLLYPVRDGLPVMLAEEAQKRERQES